MLIYKLKNGCKNHLIFITNYMILSFLNATTNMVY